MRVAIRTFICLAAISLLSGCSNFSFPGVHKIEVQQGNIITQDMVNQLRPGMTKSQVRFVLGTPLIADTFNQNRWDYFYSLLDKDQHEVRERLSVHFADNKLVRISGDYMPGGASTTQTTTGEESSERVEEG